MRQSRRALWIMDAERGSTVATVAILLMAILLLLVLAIDVAHGFTERLNKGIWTRCWWRSRQIVEAASSRKRGRRARCVCHAGLKVETRYAPSVANSARSFSNSSGSVGFVRW